MTQPRHVVIVGAGLLGTSLGLALRSGPQPAGGGAAATPTSVGWPSQWTSERAIAGPPDSDPDVVMVAVPPEITAVQSFSPHYIYTLSAIVSDMASVKSRVLLEVEQSLDDSAEVRRYVGGHPMAGRERSGPEAARGDLFGGRPWLLTPSARTSAEAVARGEGLVRSMGAEPVELSARAHDRRWPASPHAPQVVASAMAAQLAQLAPEALGPGRTRGPRRHPHRGLGPGSVVGDPAANAGPVAGQLDGGDQRADRGAGRAARRADGDGSRSATGDQSGLDESAEPLVRTVDKSA